MDSTLVTIFCGVKKCPESPFYKMPKDLVRVLYGMIVDMRQSHIVQGEISFIDVFKKARPSFFPEYSGISCNMLPFVFSRKEETLPKELHGYLALIDMCLFGSGVDQNEVMYLTVHESHVKRGETQRRPGIHIEQPLHKLQGNATRRQQRLEFAPYGWGGGSYLGVRTEGIYVATNVAHSSAAWNVEIRDLPALMGADAKEGGNTIDFMRRQLDVTVKRAAANIEAEREEDARKDAEREWQMAERERLYNLEHADDEDHYQVDEHDAVISRKAYIAYQRQKECEVREAQRPFYEVLKPHHIYWMKDSTPHCALPVEEDVHRTFFRLVCGKVGIRWTADCTPNPLVPVPADVLVIDGSKFDRDEEKRQRME